MTDKNKLDEAVYLTISDESDGTSSTTTIEAQDHLALAEILKNAGIVSNDFNGAAVLMSELSLPNGGKVNQTVQAPDLRTIMQMLEPDFQEAGDAEDQNPNELGQNGFEPGAEVLDTGANSQFTVSEPGFSSDNVEVQNTMADNTLDDIEDRIGEDADFDYRTHEVGSEPYAGQSSREVVQPKTHMVPAHSADQPLGEALGSGHEFVTYIETPTGDELEVTVGFDFDSGDFDTGLDSPSVSNMGSTLDLTSVVPTHGADDLLDHLSQDVIERLKQEALDHLNDSDVQESTPGPKSFADYVREAELNELSRGSINNYVAKVNQDDHEDAEHSRLLRRGRGLGNAQSKVHWKDARVLATESQLLDEFRVDELSQDTKDRYREKARSPGNPSAEYYRYGSEFYADNAKRTGNPEHEKLAKDYGRKADNREKGISRSYAKEEPTRHKPIYDKATGNYDIQDTQTGKIVARNVANSGGAALQAAANLDYRAKQTNEQQVDEQDLNELSRDTLSRYINKTKHDDEPKRQDGRNMALKKKWADPKYGHTDTARVPARESELDEAGRQDWQAKTRQYGQPFYLNTDCGFASLNDLGTHDYFHGGGAVVLEIDRNGKKGLNFVAGDDSTPAGTKVTCVTQTSTGQKFRPGRVVDSFTMDEYVNDRAGVEARLAKHGISPTKKLSVKTFD